MAALFAVRSESTAEESNRKIATLVDQNRNARWNKTLRKLEKGSKKYWHLCKRKYAGFVNDLMVNDTMEFTNSGKANALANAFESAHRLTLGNTSPIDLKVHMCIEQLNATTEIQSVITIH